MMGSATQHVPEDLAPRWRALLEKLQPLRDILLAQGSVQPKRPHHGHQAEFVLRYRAPARDGSGRRAHRMVYLGRDPELAERAKRQLVEWREQAREERRERCRALAAEIASLAAGWRR